MSAKDPDLYASRLAEADRTPLAANDTSVTSWNLANPFILAICLDEATGPWTAAYQLRWQDVTDGSVFTALGASGELAYTTATDLTDGAGIAEAGRITTGDPGSTWRTGEEVEDGQSSSFTLDDEYYTELHFAIDPSAGDVGHQYAFRLYDATNNSPVGDPVCTITLAAPPAPPGTLATLSHEDGDFSEYDSTNTDGGDLSVAAAAALGGSSYGVACLVDDGNKLYATKNFTIGGQDQIRFRFYFDPNGIPNMAGSSFGCQYVTVDGSYGGYSTFALLQIQNNAGTLECRVTANDDTNSANSTAWTAITDAEHYVEVHIVRETADGNADGYMDWWFDGAAQTRVSGIDNYNIFPTIDGWLTGINWWQTYNFDLGTIYFDEIEINNDGSAIGPVSGSGGLVRVIGETAQLSEAELRPRVLARLLAETAQLSEVQLWPRVMARLLAETSQVGEVQLRPRVLIRQFAETSQVAEAPGRLAGLIRGLAETVQAGEVTARARALIRRLAETVQANEAIVRVLTGAGELIRVISDAVQVSEARARVRSLARVLSETVQAGEVTARARALIRRITETTQLSEAIARVLSSAGEIVRVVMETVQAGESVARARALVRHLEETLSLGEASARARALVRALAEAVQVAETAVQLSVIGLVRVVMETVQAGETLGRIMGFVRAIGETLSLGESASRIQGLVKWIGEVVGLGETSARARALIRRLAETVQAGEAVARTRALVRTVAEELGLAEAFGRVRGLVRRLAETVQAGETSGHVPGFVRVISESISILGGVLRTAVTVILSAARTYIVRAQGRSRAARSDSRSRTSGPTDRTYSMGDEDRDGEA